MHEMSIVTSILDIAREHADREGASVIRTIEVEVGGLAGVEISALEFCFQAARAHSVGEQAEMIIHAVPGRGRCPLCGEEAEMDFFAAVCPACGKSVLDVIQGRELRVRSISVD